MNNGTRAEVIQQFDKIARLPDYWDHNQQYQIYLLKQIVGKVNTCLDVGCGTGELTNKLALKSRKTIGIDVSKTMIEEAQKRRTNNNIIFVNNDIDTFLNNTNEKYDVIISIATFHHLDMEKTLKRLKASLNDNGLILILDLYKNRTLFEHALSIIADFFSYNISSSIRLFKSLRCFSIGVIFTFPFL